jgi:hypothetical protein
MARAELNCAVRSDLLRRSQEGASCLTKSPDAILLV